MSDGAAVSLHVNALSAQDQLNKQLKGDTEKSEFNQTDPREILGENSAENTRKKLNKFLGIGASCLLVGGVVGFFPAYYTAITTNRWYFDGINRQNFPDVTQAEEKYGHKWWAMLVVHVATTAMWTLQAAFQVATGATGVPGGKRKTAHRRNGYSAALMATLIVIEAVAMQLFKKPAIPILMNGFMILFNLFFGIRYIRQKRVDQHKVAMAWTCAWTAAPGLTRLVNYAEVIFVRGCHIGFLGTGAVSLMMVCLVPAALSIRNARSWVFFVNVVAILLTSSSDVSITMHGWSFNGGWCSHHV